MGTERWHIDIGGLVQGIGFRPFVYRLAQAHELHGWVANDAQGVQMEVQGDAAQIRVFLQKLQTEKPAHAGIHKMHTARVALRQDAGFEIRESDSGAQPSAIVLPDLAPCEDCLREIFDRHNRRYRYPFTNCTHCGPRFSIVDRLPYDRANTAMTNFALCEACGREYADPQDRRFHAEPNGCPECGPQLQLCDRKQNILAESEEALQRVVAAIDNGGIVALKSVGGFQLLVDAGNAQAVASLRERKRRAEKPFALLYPDIHSVERDCHVSELENELLRTQESPIVLLAAKRQSPTAIAPGVAPGNPNLGVMLPCSPLHALLMSELGRPLVATSGNLAGEPICHGNEEAFARLGGIADLFLIHNRPIRRPLDDSIVRVMDGRTVILRRARGYAPLPIALPERVGRGGDLLAVGGQLKNTVAVSRGNTVYLSQHIGDLESLAAMDTFENAIGDLNRLYQLELEAAVCDLHPGYASTGWVEKQKFRRTGVQHHIAHLFSCMAEHTFNGSALGICWDGTGYAEGGVIRGGEFLRWDGGESVEQFASLRAFPLPGGERAIREPRRQAVGLLWALAGENGGSSDEREAKALMPGAVREAIADEAVERTATGSRAATALHLWQGLLATAPHLERQFTPGERKNLLRMLERKINTPLCTSIGRLFDAVAALLGLAAQTSFEGQAAMALEFAAGRSDTERHYPFELTHCDGRWQLDWAPMISAMLEEGERGVCTADRAAVFHNTLAQMILAVAQRAGERNLFLSGGVFQNRRLTETAAALLRQNGFRVHCHGSVPPNDGGIALGQIYFARCMADRKAQNTESSATCA